MNVLQFIASRKDRWKELERLIERLNATKNKLKKEDFQRLSRLYRSATSDYAYANTNYPQHQSTLYLSRLVAQSHALIYNRKQFRLSDFPDWIFKKVPAIFFHYRKLFWLAMGTFILFGVIGFVGCEVKPEGERIFLHFSILNPEQTFVQNAMYIDRTEQNIRKGRPFMIYEEEAKATMASGIMFNNIRVAFFAFVGGILAGTITFWMLAMTGMMVGAFFHIFYRHDIIFDFWNTIMLHGMIELTMIVMAAMAGFVLARGLLFPGSYPMKDSLTRTGLEAIQMAVVIALWLVIAGILEGFVTGANLHTWAKVVINVVSVLLLFTYWGVLGRKYRHHYRPAEDLPGYSG